jgi:hypothetical protein
MLASNIPLSQIPARLKLYEKCRYERASKIQEISRLAGQDMDSGPPPFNAAHFTNYNFGHDEWDFSTQVLRKWEWENNKSLLWRMPTAFGPMPGPRQDFYGKRRDGSKGRFTTASVKFRSSRTVLENLFPTEKFKFAAADTIAYATFAVTQLDNLEWLGGRGYSHFGLYIHGVQHTKEDGETVVGTYLPVMFENLADPILSGRDELGFPKLYCELDLKKDSQAFEMSAGWMSSKFCSLSLSGLIEAPAANGDSAASAEPEAPRHPLAPPPPPKETGLLFYKYVPATGSLGSKERGQADVEYTAFMPNDEDANTVEKKVETTLKASSAEVKFDALDWKALPTLHHIIERLKGVPIFEVVEAKVVVGSGVSDVSAGRRL